MRMFQEEGLVYEVTKDSVVGELNSKNEYIVSMGLMGDVHVGRSMKQERSECTQMMRVAKRRAVSPFVSRLK